MGTRKLIDFLVSDSGCYECTSHYRDKDGYPRIVISKQGQPISRHIYRECFGEIPESMVVRHKCDNTACINPEHLELGTKRDNAKDRDTRGRTAKGERQGSSKLNEKQVVEIKKSKLSQRKLATKYGISRSVVSYIKAGKIWSHIKIGDSNE